MIDKIRLYLQEKGNGMIILTYDIGFIDYRVDYVIINKSFILKNSERM